MSVLVKRLKKGPAQRWGRVIIINDFSTAVAGFQGGLLPADLLASSWNMSQGRYF